MAEYDTNKDYYYTSGNRLSIRLIGLFSFFHI